MTHPNPDPTRPGPPPGPGPDRPGKLRLIAEMVTSSFVRETPGPALMHAPHDGSTKIAPTSAKTRS